MNTSYVSDSIPGTEKTVRGKESSWIQGAFILEEKEAVSKWTNGYLSAGDNFEGKLIRLRGERMMN